MPRGLGKPVAYGILAAVLLASIFPLYWSFVVATKDKR